MSGPKHFLSMYGGQVQGNFVGLSPNLNQILPQDPNQELYRRIDRSKIYKFQNKASGIILIKQDYRKLFYNPNKKLNSPIQYAEILFYTRKNSQEEVLKIILSNRKIELEYNKPQLEGEKTQKVGLQTFEPNQIFFPKPEDAPMMLQKKIWIQLNRLNRSLSIYSGDIVNYKGQRPLVHVQFKGPDTNRVGWSNEAEKFQIPTYNKSTKKTSGKLIEPFTEIQFFYVNFKIDQSNVLDKRQGQNISDFLSLQVLNLGRIFDPVIQQKVSLLKPSLANLESMPTPLRNLYECLSGLNIRNLPDFSDDTMDFKEKNDYLNWRQLQFALHHSLVTPYGYSLEGIPLGIMNHLYKMKCKKQYKEFKYFKIEGNQKTFLSKEQMLDQIYNNRAGYIRLELLPHEGLGPGSMAVLEIWPPFHCSSIHNHGDAYGLIKVLSGSIRVQNFSELAFSALENKPYIQNDYLEDQYSWLSELSFGIHRLVNVKPQTCFTLQSYYHNEVTEEYFSVIKKINGVHTYIEYYPQNDWVNYLNERDNTKNDAKDREFINRVISRYGLNINGKLDTSFQRLVLALKRQYEHFHRTLATEYFQ